MIEYVTNSYEETLECAEQLAKRLPKGSVIAFLGDLGAGKTAFTTGFVKGLGITEHVSSPTFSMCNVYKGSGNEVWHYDMYRVETWDDLYSIGFFDAVDSQAYMLIEWSENVYGALDSDAVIVNIEKLGENQRRIKIMNKKEAESELGIIG